MTEAMLVQADRSGFGWEVVKFEHTKDKLTDMLGPTAKSDWSDDFLDTWRDDKFSVYTFTWKKYSRSAKSSIVSPIQRLQEILMQHK